jgi:hypothetical protein
MKHIEYHTVVNLYKIYKKRRSIQIYVLKGTR